LPSYRVIMKNLAASSALALGTGLLAFAPGALVTLWHIFIWLLSAGLFVYLVEEYGDLDASIVAIAIFCLMLTGLSLSLFSGIGWTYSLALALPLLGAIGFLIIRNEQH
jgi:hypothetical protein